MRFSTVIWMLLGCFAVLAAVIIGSIKTLGSAGQYKETLKAYIQGTFGREVIVNGTFEIRSDLPPKLIMTDVVLANKPGMSRPGMMRIGHLEAEADLGALFLHTLKIRRIEATDVDLLLERNEAGVANWDFPSFSDLPSSVMETLDLPPFPGLATLRKINIKRMRLAWRDDRLGNDHILFSDVFLTMPNDIAPINIVAKGVYDDTPFGLSGTVGGLRTLDSVLNGGDRYPLRLRWQGAKMTAVVDGAVKTGKAEDSRLSLRLRMNGNDFPGIRTNKEIPFPGPFSISGNLEITSDGWGLHKTDIALGMLDGDMLRYRGKIGSLFPLREPEGKLTVRLDSLRDISKWAGIDFPRVGPVKASISARKATNGRIRFVMENGTFGDDALNADLLADFVKGTLKGKIDLSRFHVDAWSDGWGHLREESSGNDRFSGGIELEISAKEIAFRKLAARDVGAKVRIAGKEIAVRPLSLLMDDGRIEGWFLWDRMDNASLWMEGNDLNAGKILGGLDVLNAPGLGTGRFFLTLNGRGEDMSSILSSAGGEIWLLGEKGRIPRLDALQPLLPSATSFECVASVAEVEDGAVRRMALMMDGQGMMLAGQGRVGLSENGKADLVFAVREKGQGKRPGRVVGLKGPVTAPVFVPLPHAPAAVPALPVVVGGDFSPCLMAVIQRRSPGTIPSVFRNASAAEEARVE